jgi:DNA-binding MarR family transcriptional regulator
MALDQLVRALNDLYRLSGSARVHADTVRVTGVVVTQTGLRFLSLIEDSPRISASELADSADVSQPTASRVLQSLENDEYVVRHQSDVDGRVSHYVTTTKGKRALQMVQSLNVVLLALDQSYVVLELSQLIVLVVDELVARFMATAEGKNRRTA